MATYTYEVIETGEIFEVTQSMNDDALVAHPTLGPVRRIIAPAGGHRIGGVNNSTSMWNVSGDPGPRRKGYDCDPTN